MASVSVDPYAQVRLKMISPAVTSYYENIGYLNTDSQDDPIVISNSDTLSAAVANDLNDALNGLASLTQSSITNKIVEYTMELND